MGQMEVPADALYGASTRRAVLNFPVSGRPVPEPVIRAYARIKAAAARVNGSLDRLETRRVQAIEKACDEILAGLLDRGGLARHFPIDIFQTGSGTSTNMNVNEVIANLVCLQGGKPIGAMRDQAWIDAGGVHPNDHANMGQSSNDTFPTAMNVAAAEAITRRLLPAVRALAEELETKAQELDGVVKIGRTHLQDATPIRLGQEFAGYAAQVREGERRLGQALETLCSLAIGGTAVGTGINTHKDFGRLVAQDIAKQTRIDFREASNHFEAQHSRDAIVETSGHLRTLAISLTKIAGDIRLMGSGPRCGFGELKLPAVQPGSSIMPGKVNPVICESLIMACCQVLGNDAATAMGNVGGVGSLLDLNVAMPMMAANVLDSIGLLANGCEMFTGRLLIGLEADEERCRELIEQSLAMCTSLAPVIGYDRAADLAKRAYAEGRTVRELAEAEAVLAKEELDRLLDPASMTAPSEE